MNSQQEPEQPARRYSPLLQLILARLREFWREPEAIFWVYGFPILLTVALGIAFRNKPVDQIAVDVQEGPGADKIVAALSEGDRFAVHVCDATTCRLRLKTGKTELVVIRSASAKLAYEYVYAADRPESLLARNEVNDTLQRKAGRREKVAAASEKLEEPGGRYIDFLVPGLLGMSLMGGGLWGVGFVTVDMRIRKLLKRFLATPMKKNQFLAAIMLSRLAFMVPEVLLLLVFARIVFGVVIQGSVLALTALIVLGAFTFAGIGLLVASRARTVEAVSGLMNLVMLPMWVLSGIFFSSERFPAAAQPFIKALPLTPLINALRAVTLEGASLASQTTETAILAAWGVVTFLLALRWFRWT
ncbi:MAG TPA: ABC transporter permease [Gemmataceae bacterium]|jgi:ABC-type multidrug transport system permease subunit|nr:ABC transporter permease [Gemmataceae bacterium]